ncbi:MAG: endonuclease/exonuclease/phosphatase family protein [Candidatus Thiodiazotropha taylori]|nr:endonuclease/exonuclease/phosphatase family protein [Candidatus Thiodiazotropha taylori]
MLHSDHVTKLKITSLNVQGLRKYTNDSVFKKYCEQFDIIALYETWQEHNGDFENFIEGYHNFDSMRKKKRSVSRGSGGVSVFVRDWILLKPGVKRIFQKFSECVVLLLKADTFNRNEDLIMFFTYVAPENSPIYTDEDNGIFLLKEKISEIVAEYPTAEIFIAGDLNARIGNLQDYIPSDDLEVIFGDTDYPSDPFDMQRHSKDETYNRFGISLLELCCIFNVHVLNGRLFDDKNGEITCVANNGSSIVDYILASTTLFDSFLNFQIGSADFSDHFPLQCTLKLSNDILQNQESFDAVINKNTWTKFKWKDGLKNEFLQLFSRLFSRFRDKISAGNEPATTHLTEFIGIFKTAGKCMQSKFCNHNKNCRKQPPWWDNECKSTKANKTILLRKYRRTNASMDLHRYKMAKARFKNICRSKRFTFEKGKRAELMNVSRNPREYWRVIKRNCNKKVNSESKISSENWVNYFKNLLNMEVRTENDTLLQNITNQYDTNELNRQISNEEIILSIKLLHSNRSPGPDGICIEMFKHTKNEILTFLNCLFNELFEKGEVPPDWCKNIICPLHKSGALTNPENFRGISLINSISKIYTGILTTRVQKWAEDKGVVDESQAGFRRGYSTVDNIFSLQAVIQKYLSRPRGRFYCIFIDFRRAFDSIPHNKLWESLRRKGINDDSKIMKTFKSMYSQLKSCVKVSNSLSQFFECSIGTRQGCVSSPIIFTLFINDLISYLRSELEGGIFITNDIEDGIALMFADDVSCFADTVIHLQRLINLIEKFCKSVGMQLNLNKTKIMVFRNGGIVKQTEKWFYQGTEIEIVSMYKYLGLYFTPKLIWTKTKALLALQAQKAASSIFRFQKQFGCFQPPDAFKLFDSMVKPIAIYGAEIWGYMYAEEIEKIQTKFCKQFIGLKQNTADIFVLGECGRLPLAVSYLTQCVKYWVKLTQMPNHRYPRQCYLMLRSLTEAGRMTWATHIKTLLFEHGFGYVWIADSVGNNRAFISVFMQRIKDISLQNWRRSINDSPKADHYKYFKTQLDVEKYLFVDLSFNCRRALANFRCSSHNLQIEKGRHLNIEREYRFCTFCRERCVYVVEDIFHFFMVCPLYHDLRSIYFKPSWTSLTTVHKFYSIMKLTDIESIFSKAKFIVSAFDLRKSLYGT